MSIAKKCLDKESRTASLTTHQSSLMCETSTDDPIVEKWIASLPDSHVSPSPLLESEKKERDKQNMWPETIRVIREVGPGTCFLENVPGLLTSYFGEILRDLAESGFNARWKSVSAAEVGAPHIRDRLWVLAHTYSFEEWRQQIAGTERKAKAEPRHIRKTAWWKETEPALCGVSHGMADRLLRLKALGNGIVPAVARAAWVVMTDNSSYEA